ncbi:MAG: hypothetical protein IRY85_16355 [Micromonosporaceae bacterium]|nr:hypothetical protein [Micromonosporaceae bacterium]
MRTAVTGAWRRYTANAVAVGATIAVAYLAVRLVIILGGTVFESHDSAVYAPREDPSRNHGPLVSLVGNAPRPWGLPAFYALFGSDEWRTVGQWALATVAWAAFAWEVSRHLRTRAARVAVVVAILVFACVRDVASWDLAILTESTSISLGVLVLTFLLRWLRTGSWVAVTAMTLFAVWWTFIRPDIRVFTTVVMATLLLIAGRVIWRGRRPAAEEGAPLAAVATRTASRPAPNTRRTVTAAVASCLVLGLGLVWYAAITPGMERAMVPYDGDAIDPPLPQDEYRFVYRLRVDVSTNPELWAAYTTEIGMPTCPELEAFTSDTLNWRGREWAEAYRRCPALVEWVQERKSRYFWMDLVTADPVLFVKTFVRQLSLTLGGEVYAHVPRVVPIEKLAFPSRRFGLPLALLGFGATLALAWWAGALRSHRRLVWFAVGVFAAALLSATATIVMVTGELQRFGVQEAVATRVAMLVLLGCALDAWLIRRRGLEPADGATISSTGAARPGPAQAAA